MEESDNIFSQHNSMLLSMLQQLRAAPSLEHIRHATAAMLAQLGQLDSDLLATAESIEIAELRHDYLCGELQQIAETRTLERARYYIERLIKGITEARTSGINDINLNRWKEYDHIWTDSWWDVKRRDNSGAHMADYWGNFIPQIPHQVMQRYTRQGDWVLDTFAGSGTTLIEGQRLGRNTLGIELQASIIAQARQRIAAEPNHNGVVCKIVQGDSTAIDYAALLQRYGQQQVQLLILHPPYFDIIKFSDEPRDLSNAVSVDAFLAQMGTLIERAAVVLQPGRYLVLVIGDKYAAGEWIPLGFLTMQEVLQRGFMLKSIVVKNFEGTTAKRNQKELWRYRALANGFYIFKHEYIFICKKQPEG